MPDTQSSPPYPPHEARTEIVHPEAEEVLDRLRRLGHLLDEAFEIPGTGFRIGLDGLIGLIPGVGDTITTIISAYIVNEARRVGVPKHVLVRMSGNVALDWLVGLVPLVGDIFDFGFKANRRNLKLLEKHLLRHTGTAQVRRGG